MDLLGKTLGNYRIDRLLGKGSIGDVYQANDLSQQRKVAIEVIHAQFARQPGFRESFPREVSAAAELNHPGIIRVLDFGQHKEQLYIVMEYLPGKNLRQVLDELIQDREWISLNDAIRLAEQLCQTVEYAHQKGSICWDLKPANLMLKPKPENGLPFRIILTDLRIARLVESAETAEVETSPGTAAYMSPEQALRKETDPRSDVYSLGVLVYELIVGIPPFPIKTVKEALLYHSREFVPAPRSIRPDLPNEVEQVMLKALEREPANRYSSAAELGTALGGAMGQVTEIVERDDAPDGNLFKKYQESLGAPLPVESVNLLGDSEAGQTEMQPLFVTEREELPPKSEISIQVVFSSGEPQTYTFEGDTVTIGRDRKNDLVIEDSKVSRRHAQVTWDGSSCYVTDLNSANGTYLENKPLQANIPTIWQPHQGLRIGGASLRVKSHVPSGTVVDSYDVGRRTSMEDIEGFEGDPLVVSVTPQQLTVEAGGSLTVNISLLNQNPDTDYFLLSLSGIPENWISSLPPHVQLMPGERKVTAFTLHIPLEWQSRAGRHSLRLRVISQHDMEQFVEVKLTLTVVPFSQFKADLEPDNLRTGQLGRVTITNLGNIKETFTVQFTDPVGDLTFQPPQIQTSIQEGKSVYTEFRAQERSLRVLGGEKSHPFNVQVSTPNVETQTLHAEVFSRGFMPVWVLPMALLFCLLITGSASALWYYTNQKATLTVSMSGSGTVTITSSPESINNCTATCTFDFDEGTSVTLSAAPTSLYTFGGWSEGGCSDPLLTTCTVTMSGDQTVTATFNLPGKKTLTVTKTGTGKGTVTSSSVGINGCTTVSCSFELDKNAPVILTAAPEAPSTFGGWGGACSSFGTALTCTITMSELQFVTATFNLPGKLTLTVIKAGTGSGTITSAPSGISNCTATCSFDFEQNTEVTLTATANSGSVFGSWSIASCSNTGITCKVTMNAAQTITATFNGPSDQSLTVTVSNSTGASGTVTSSPSGINNCNASCSANFPYDKDVTLTAINGSSSTFVNWGGDCASFGSSLTCTIRMSAPRTITATFKASDSQVVTASITANSKVYDGTNLATVQCTVNGVSASHNVTCSASPATFATKDVGTWQVTASGLTLGGTDASKYKLSSTTATTSASITVAKVTASITAANKTYDGTTIATLTGCTLSGFKTGDDVGCRGTSNFADASASTNKTVTANDLTLTGTAMSNYVLSSTTVTTTATITQATPKCNVTPYNVPFDNQPHKVSGSCNGVNGEILSVLNLDSTIHTNVGTYPDTWSFHDSNGNYRDASNTVTNTITFVITPSPTITQTAIATATATLSVSATPTRTGTP